MSLFRRNANFLVLLTAGLVFPLTQSPAAESFDLSDRRSVDDLVSVKVTVATRGVVRGATLGQAEEKVELTVRGQLAYEERLLSAPPKLQSVRQYDAATSQIVIGDHAETNQLDASRNLIVVSGKQRVSLFSPVGALTRQEFDVLSAPACSLTCYGWLPGKPVAVGQSWRPAADAVASVLRLDHVGVNQVVIQLVDVARGLARMRITGTVKGMADGATTEIRLTGDLRYDLRWNHVTWLQMAVQETRDEGPVSVPYIARADVRMLISPVEGASKLTRVPAEVTQASAQQAATLRCTSETGGFEILHHTDWHLTGERGQRATFRLIDNDQVVAQCNVSRLPDMPAGKQLALEDFQRDIRVALGEQFVEFESANQAPRQDGYRTLQVAARGIVSKVPIRWIYYHVADQEGRCAAYVFTLATELNEKFAGRDQLLVDSIRFAPDPPAPTTPDLPPETAGIRPEQR